MRTSRRPRARGRSSSFHHPPYSNGFHGGDVVIREAIEPLLERYRVDLAISGQDHLYERTYPIQGNHMCDAFQEPSHVAPRGIIHVVIGGGGAPRYDFIPTPEAHLDAVFVKEHHYFNLRVTPEMLEGTAISDEKEEIDRFTIQKSGEGAPLRFVRGDTNEDGDVNLSDGVAILTFLFSGAPPPCLAASDTDDSGDHQLNDAVQPFTFLVLGGPPPAAPYPACDTLLGALDVGCKGSCEGE